MPHLPADRGIPTLTQRSESARPLSAPLPDIPLLTEVAHDAKSAYADTALPPLTVAADTAAADALPTPAEAAKPDGAPDTPPDLAQAPVLAARLQAEVEQVMRQALIDAIEQMQARMDAALPPIVARVLQEVRSG